MDDQRSAKWLGSDIEAVEMVDLVAVVADGGGGGVSNYGGGEEGGGGGGYGGGGGENGGVGFFVKLYRCGELQGWSLLFVRARFWVPLYRCWFFLLFCRLSLAVGAMTPRSSGFWL